MFSIGQAPLHLFLLPSSGPGHFDGPTFLLISHASFVLSGEVLSLEEEGKGSRGNPGREDQRGWWRGAGADRTLSLAGNQPNTVKPQKLDPVRKMSGRQVSRSNTYNRLSQPNNMSFPPRTPGWTQYPNMNNGKGLRSRLPSGSGSESSTSGHSEQSFSSTSPGFPLGKICMGRPYNSRCVETSHLMRGPKVVKKPTCHRSSPHCLICTDRPSSPSAHHRPGQMHTGWMESSNLYWGHPIHTASGVRSQPTGATANPAFGSRDHEPGDISTLKVKQGKHLGPIDLERPLLSSQATVRF